MTLSLSLYRSFSVCALLLTRAAAVGRARDGADQAAPVLDLVACRVGAHAPACRCVASHRAANSLTAVYRRLRSHQHVSALTQQLQEPVAKGVIPPREAARRILDVRLIDVSLVVCVLLGPVDIHFDTTRLTTERERETEQPNADFFLSMNNKETKNIKTRGWRWTGAASASGG
jgi:hypothetical protein